MKYLSTLFFLSIFSLMQAQDYPTLNEIQSRAKNLGNQANVNFQSLGKSASGKEIFGLQIGEDKNPAIAILAGIDGKYIHGADLALRLAEALAKEKEVLKTASFYIIPVVSPDAYMGYFSKIKKRNPLNHSSFDNDRDGRMNEDPFEDLNKDGVITMMRVEDETGHYKMLDKYESVMVKAKVEEGEKGTHRLLTEGLDNDQDGVWNEDGEGGVNINHNFPYQFPSFKSASGNYAASETETRDLLDFLFDQWNIHTTISFGPANSLMHPWKHNAAKAKQRIVSSIQEADEKVYQQISKIYKEKISQKEAPKVSSSGGDFNQWAYFHYGRFSYSTPAWWVPKIELDTAAKAPKPDLDNETVRFIEWAKKENIANAFIPWENFTHPDFPNHKVEIGGVNTMLSTVPPYDKMDEIEKEHLEFVTAVANMLPQIHLKNIKTEKMGSGLTRLSLEVYNAGLLPTGTEIGQRTRWVRKPKVELLLNANQQCISGRPIQVLKIIKGDESVHLTWLIQGNGSIKVKAGSAICGFDEQQISLK